MKFGYQTLKTMGLVIVGCVLAIPTMLAVPPPRPAIGELASVHWPPADTTAERQEAEDRYSWLRNDSSLTLMKGQQVVWRFNFGSDQGKPFFDPVNLPGMGNLTWNAPPDHPWHHGLWFSWKLINGVNYWEEDRKTGLSDGRTTWTITAIDPGDDYSARIEMRLKYSLPGKPPVLLEHRVIDVFPPDADGGYSIDWNGTFKATDQPVLLDRTPLPNEPNGKIYGGYAGLSVRLAKEAAAFEVENAGTTGTRVKAKQPTRIRFRSLAVDNAGSMNGVTGGIAIFDHPGNLNSPSPWYIIRDTKSPMTYFSPAVIQKRPHQLAAGDSFTLRYRISIHPGRFDVEALRRHYRRFTGGEKK